MICDRRYLEQKFYLQQGKNSLQKVVASLMHILRFIRVAQLEFRVRNVAEEKRMADKLGWQKMFWGSKCESVTNYVISW